MGESSACLMRSFSHPSDASREAKEGDPLRALGESISFGRYMSEPLAWEKWSSFSHNRYLEEVEKFSKPGSVAQKKAYFEAHYKKIAAKKAAALLEQENAMTNNSPEQNITNEIHNSSSMDSELSKSDSHIPIVEMQGNGDPDAEIVDANSVCSLNIDASELKSDKVEGAEVQHVITENSIYVGLSNRLENVENHSRIIVPQEENLPKDAANHGNSASTSKKKQAISSSKLSAYSGASKLQSPAKPTTSLQARKGENANSNSSKKSNRDWMDKKRSTPKSLHMSINLSSGAEETSKTSSPILQKLGNSRIVRTFVKAYKDDSSRRQTPTRASVMGVLKHPSVPTQPENRRTKTLLDRSVSGSRTVDGKSQFLSRDNLEASRLDGNKARSPTISSSFSFRSEERAAKRKEFFQKLEEKISAKETEKVKPQAKSQEKAEHDFKKMRQSIGFKAKPNTNIPCETESPSDHRKIPLTRPRSPKLGRKPTPSMVQDTSSRPPRRPSVKTDGTKHVTEKNKQAPTRSINHFSKKNMHENASPNMQF
ncbi:protein WVD2-like 7 [Cornus florida]|uniref:protein WVD2-like 7 n=1 Tax=Cornus florida TaxID=4283 RepID=UPI0028999E21|nr:protein WVD2-like 7 [Cornus florida]